MSGDEDDKPDDPSAEGEDVSSGEAMRWAAEEPTAMWDESMLHDEGFDALVNDRASNPREETGPATTQGVGGADASKVKVSASATGGHPAVAGKRTKKQGGLSWTLTIVLAIGLAFAVYVLVSYLR